MDEWTIFIDDKEDTESGIHMTEEDDTAVATPTSLKSPPIIGNAGLPSFSYHRAFSEGDDESASRRSSVSEEFTGGGNTYRYILDLNLSLIFFLTS